MIRKIISGGQTGADQGALDAAIEYGFPYGGWLPKGRLTENGPLLEQYRLQEMCTKDYKKRTLQNILDSDGTLIVSRGKLNGGSKLTYEYAHKNYKPKLHIDLYKTPQFLAVSSVYNWIHNHNIRVLNVAGPRASKDPKIYEDVKFIIQGVLSLVAVNAPPGAELEDYSQDQYIKNLPFPPRTVDEAIDRLIDYLDLHSRVKFARKSPQEFLDQFQELYPSFKNEFGQWLRNAEFFESCKAISPEPLLNPDDATAVVIGMLYKRLHETHRLKIVK